MLRVKKALHYVQCYVGMTLNEIELAKKRVRERVVLVLLVYGGGG